MSGQVKVKTFEVIRGKETFRVRESRTVKKPEHARAIANARLRMRRHERIRVAAEARLKPRADRERWVRNETDNYFRSLLRRK